MRKYLQKNIGQTIKWKSCLQSLNGSIQLTESSLSHFSLLSRTSGHSTSPIALAPFTHLSPSFNLLVTTLPTPNNQVLPLPTLRSPSLPPTSIDLPSYFHSSTQLSQPNLGSSPPIPNPFTVHLAPHPHPTNTKKNLFLFLASFALDCF